MASFFEKCANVLLAIACAVVVGEFAYRHVNRSNTIPRLFNAGQLIEAKPSPQSSRRLTDAYHRYIQQMPVLPCEYAHLPECR